MCEFYGHPDGAAATEELGRRALDYVLKCETRLLIIDDLHFLHWQNKGGIGSATTSSTSSTTPDHTDLHRDRQSNAEF